MPCYPCGGCNKCGMFSVKAILVCASCGTVVPAGSSCCPGCGCTKLKRKKTDRKEGVGNGF